MRTLTLVATLLAFLFSGYACTAQRFFMNVPLDGTYGGQAVTTAQSLNQLKATVGAITVGYEICFPASGEPIYGWVDNQAASENDHGEGALAWAGGAGTYYQGSEALIGCQIHEIHLTADEQWQDAKGDPGNDGQDSSHICIRLIGAAQNEDFFPLVNGCTA